MKIQSASEPDQRLSCRQRPTASRSISCSKTRILAWTAVLAGCSSSSSVMQLVAGDSSSGSANGGNNPNANTNNPNGYYNDNAYYQQQQQQQEDEWGAPPPMTKATDYSASTDNLPPPPPPSNKKSSPDSNNYYPPPPSQQGYGSASYNNNDGYYQDQYPSTGYANSMADTPQPMTSADPSSNSHSGAPPANTGAPRPPIHYEFPQAPKDRDGTGDEDDLAEKSRDAPTASARQDVLTRYLSTTKGKFQVYSSATLIGTSFGVFLAKSLLPFGSALWGGVSGVIFLFSAIFFRTPFGELVRAMGLALVLVLQKSKDIRKNYPTWRYVRASLGMKPKARYTRDGRPKTPSLRPFPPTRNPWRYSPQREDDPEFNMLYSLVAMALVGSAVGGNLPVIPTWMGSLAGAAMFGLGCTRSTPRGDLCRTLGMRVVGFVQELWEIQAELGIFPKSAVVSSQVIDRLMVFDRQHKVKDKFLKLVNSGYDQVIQTGARVQAQRLETQGRNSRGDGARDDDDDGERRPRRESDDFLDGERRGTGRRPSKDSLDRRTNKDGRDNRYSRHGEQERRRSPRDDDIADDDLPQRSDDNRRRSDDDDYIGSPKKKGWFGRKQTIVP